MKSISVLLFPDRIVFCSTIVTKAALKISSAPYIHLPPDAGPEEIATALDKVIAAHRENVAHPLQSEWKGLQQSYFKGIGVKGMTELHRQAVECTIEDNGNEFIFRPGLNSGAENGFTPLPQELKIVLSKSSSSAQIASALFSAFETGKNAV